MHESIPDLGRYDVKTLMNWWVEFHFLRWPADFPMPEPPEWAGLTATCGRVLKAVNEATALAIIKMEDARADG
jgi:hypothetical protein